MHLRSGPWCLARHPSHFAGDPATGKGSGNEGVGSGLGQDFAQALVAREPPQ